MRRYLRSSQSPSPTAMGDEAGSSSLKRVLDLKLVYDCLADSSSGLVRVDLIASWWPSSAIAASKLPRGCVEFWRESANAEGLIDWESFSSSLERALKADASRLHEGELLRSEDQSLVSGKRRSIAHVTAGEIERFLSLSHAGSLVRALSRAGRDVHRWQVSIHKLNSSGFGPAGAKTRTGVYKESPVSQLMGRKGDKAGKKHHSSFSLGQEKDELMKGAQVLEKTHKWFQDRLAVLSLEETRNETAQPAPVVAAMEAEEESEILWHLQEISTHLILLVPRLPTATGVDDGAAGQHVSPPLVLLKRPAGKPPHSQPLVVVEFPRERTRLIGGPGRVGSAVSLEQRRGRPSKSSFLTGGGELSYSDTGSMSSRRKPRRSSSFNSRDTAPLTQPLRAATSASMLNDQCTDYPGHHKALQSPNRNSIRHSSSLRSLPTAHYFPFKQGHPSSGTPTLHHPPSSPGPTLHRPPSSPAPTLHRPPSSPVPTLHRPPSFPVPSSHSNKRCFLKQRSAPSLQRAPPALAPAPSNQPPESGFTSQLVSEVL